MFTPFTEGTYEIVLQDRETKRPIRGCNITNQTNVVAQFARGPHLYTRAFVQTSASPFYDCTTCGGNPCSCEPNGRAVELAFYRDDHSEAAWIGPVIGMSSSDLDGSFTIVAQDRLWWVEGAVSDRDIIGTFPVNDAILMLLEAADRYEPSGLSYAEFADTVQPCDVEVDLEIEAGQGVWSPLLALDTLAWWTVVGEQFYWGCPALDLDCGPPIRSSSSFVDGGIVAERQFGAVATRVRMVGMDGLTVLWPPDGDAEPLNGQGRRTLERSNANLDTVAEVEAAAIALFEANRGPSNFLISGESSLGRNVNFGLHNLIPGRCYDVVKDTGCLQSSENRILSRVIVDIATVSGDGGRRVLRETRVAADFSPLDTAAQPTSISA